MSGFRANGGGSAAQGGHVAASDNLVNTVLGKDEGMLPVVGGGAAKGLR